MNETSGTIAYDVVGGYNGTYNSAPGGSYSLAQAGPAHTDFGNNSLSGAVILSSYVNIPKELRSTITGPVTAVAWVQLVTVHRVLTDCSVTVIRLGASVLTVAPASQVVTMAPAPSPMRLPSTA